MDRFCRDTHTDGAAPNSSQRFGTGAPPAFHSYSHKKKTVGQHNTNTNHDATGGFTTSSNNYDSSSYGSPQAQQQQQQYNAAPPYFPNQQQQYANANNNNNNNNNGGCPPPASGGRGSYFPPPPPPPSYGGGGYAMNNPNNNNNNNNFANSSNSGSSNQSVTGPTPPPPQTAATAMTNVNYISTAPNSFTAVNNYQPQQQQQQQREDEKQQQHLAPSGYIGSANIVNTNNSVNNPTTTTISAGAYSTPVPVPVPVSGGGGGGGGGGISDMGTASASASAVGAIAHANAAASYSAVGAADRTEHSKEDSTSTPFRNYNNHVKKALIQSAIDLIAAKMATADAEMTRRAEEEAAAQNGNDNNNNNDNNRFSSLTPNLTTAKITHSLNGSFSLPPPAALNSGSGAAAVGGGGTTTATAAHLPPPPPYGSRTLASNRQFYFGPNGRGITVLDLASGRGGDVAKWIYGQCPPYAKLMGHHTNDPSKFLAVKKYLAVDIAPGAVEAALARYNEARTQPMAERMLKVRHNTPLADAFFFVGNCLAAAFFDHTTAAQSGAPLGGGRQPSTSFHLLGGGGSMATTPKAVRPLHAGDSPSAASRPQQFSFQQQQQQRHSPHLPPSYTDAIGSAVAQQGQGPQGMGILNRSAPNTPQHQPASRAPGCVGVSPMLPSAGASLTSMPQTSFHLGGAAVGSSPGTAHAPPPPPPPPSAVPVITLPQHAPIAISTVGEALGAANAADEVNIVSVQFAFHYACYSAENLRQTLHGIAKVLRHNRAQALLNSSAEQKENSILPGGVLLLTTVDAAELTARLVKAYNDQLPGEPTVRYSSPLYSVIAPTDAVQHHVYEQIDKQMGAVGGVGAAPTLPLGTMYTFKLDGLVDCQEFVIPFADLVAAAAAEGLTLVDSKPFSHWIPDFSSNKKVKQQLGGDGDLKEADLDLISIYRTFMFAI